MNWKTKALAALRKHLERRTVQFTEKANRELAELELHSDDAWDALMALNLLDLVDRIHSTSSGEWLYIFKPEYAEQHLYVKIALRNNCDVISFHPDRGEEFDEEE